ncbi:MAG: lytic transglycosylase domain-containing protein [Verrucomicrobiota bacterium]
MPDRRYLQDERLIIRILAIAGGTVVFLAIFSAIFFRTHRTDLIPQEEVWAFIANQAPKSGLNPEFVYAIAWAESSLDARARSSVARGIMQLTKVAWREVTDRPYREAWDWQTNILVAMDYLAFCRNYLLENNAFSYPMLAACYRYGPYRVEKSGFSLAKLPKPKNAIYKKIFKGVTRPVPPPAGSRQF